MPTVTPGTAPPSTVMAGPVPAIHDFVAASMEPMKPTPNVVDGRHKASHDKRGRGAVGASPPLMTELTHRFTEAHRRLYGFAAEDEPIQLVTFRVEASAIVPKATFVAEGDAGPDATAAIIGTRSVWLPESGGATDCPVYDRARLHAGNRFKGPAIIEQMDATTVVLPGWTARVEPFRNLILEAE